MSQEFNRFLFALVGTDRDGGQLSVVSALARLDLDAWAEAATLSRLPRAAAVTKLSGMLRRYPEIPRIGQEAGVVAARLIALLPAAAQPERPAGTAPTEWTAGTRTLGLAVILMLGLLLGLQCLSQTPPQHLSAPTALAKPGQVAAPPIP